MGCENLPLSCFFFTFFLGKLKRWFQRPMIAPLTFTQISDVSPTTCYSCTLAQTRPAEAQLDSEALLPFRTIGGIWALPSGQVSLSWCGPPLHVHARAPMAVCVCRITQLSSKRRPPRVRWTLRFPANAVAKSPGGWRRSRRRSRRHTIPHYYALKTSTSTTSTSTRNRCSCVEDEVQLDDPFVELSTSGTLPNETTLNLPPFTAFADCCCGEARLIGFRIPIPNFTTLPLGLCQFRSSPVPTVLTANSTVGTGGYCELGSRWLRSIRCHSWAWNMKLWIPPSGVGCGRWNSSCMGPACKDSSSWHLGVLFSSHRSHLADLQWR